MSEWSRSRRLESDSESEHVARNDFQTATFRGSSCGEKVREWDTEREHCACGLYLFQYARLFPRCTTPSAGTLVAGCMSARAKRVLFRSGAPTGGVCFDPSRRCVRTASSAGERDESRAAGGRRRRGAIFEGKGCDL